MASTTSGTRLDNSLSSESDDDRASGTRYDDQPRRKKKKKSKFFRMHEVTVNSFQAVKTETNLKLRQGARDIQQRKNPCGKDCTVLSLFILLFGAMSMIAVALNNLDIIPGNRDLLQIGQSLEVTVTENEKQFFDLPILQGTRVAIFMSNADPALDTTMTLLRGQRTVLAFNNDLASDNGNSIIFFLAENSENLILEINPLVVEGNPNFTLNAEEIDTQVLAGQLTLETVKIGDIFVAILPNLNMGTTYDILAFDLTAKNFEPDTSIRIRRQDGTEIIEVFQSTVTELTARVLFTPDDEGPFIIEIREIVGENVLALRVLVTEINPFDIDVNLLAENSIASNRYTLFDEVSTVLKFSLDANFTYRLSLDIDLEDGLGDDLNSFTAVDDEELGKEIRFDTLALIPGVSFRVQDIATNAIIERGRTDIVEVNRTEVLNNETFLDFIVDFEAVGEDSTSVEISTFNNIEVLMDISRWNPQYEFENAEDINLTEVYGSFIFTVVKEPIDPLEIEHFNILVDENDLYPDCDIEQNKHTIDDDTCEQGIVLYCRNEFFPLINTSEATKEQFTEICECAEFLCDSLPSGVDIGREVQVFLNVFYGIFTTLAIIGIIIYVVAHVDLYRYRVLKVWIRRHQAFSTWTFLLLFLIMSSMYFITQIRLRREILIMEDIALTFDLDRIPNAADELQYSYYDAYVEKLVDVYEEPPPENLGDFFLNNEALGVVERSNSFSGIQSEVNLNIVASVFKDVLSVIVFLDVSISWVSATRVSQLNREKRAQQDRNFRRLIRIIETCYMVALFLFLSFFLMTDGDSYNVFPSIVTLILSTIVVVIYSVGRYRLHFYLEVSKLASENTKSNLWELIHIVGSVVIVANLGVILVMIYLISNVRNFDELVASANDPVAQVMFLFRDLCEFFGMAAIFYYIFNTFQEFRKSLFRPRKTILSDEGNQDSVGAVTHNERTFFMREELKTPDALKADGSVSQVSDLDMPSEDVGESRISEVL